MRSAKSAKSHGNVAQERHSGKKRQRAHEEFLPGIVDGERVLIYTPAQRKKIRELERAVQKRCEVALACAGFYVRPHIIQACWRCFAPPVKQTGLGTGTSDLFVMAKPSGRCGFIEIKVPGYSPSDVSEGQRAFLRDAALWGAATGIATNEEEALAIARRLVLP